MTLHYLVGMLGIITIFAVGFLFSENRSAVNWRSVLGAFCISSRVCGLYSLCAYWPGRAGIVFLVLYLV